MPTAAAAIPETHDPVDDLIAFIDASPTPWHAAANTAAMLTGAGFTEHSLSGSLAGEDGRGFLVRGGSVVAWRGNPGVDGRSFRMIGAHTDSPGLRVRPRPDMGAAGLRQIGVEPYGGTLLNSWLDRDLTVAGRVSVREPDAPGGIGIRLFHHHEPLLRVAQLAIHLDRDVNEHLALDRQRHIQPIWGIGATAEGDFKGFLAEALDLDPGDLLGWDAALADVAPPVRLGRLGELLASPRLDNLCSCYGAIRAITDSETGDAPAVVVLYDHEEVGSTSATGAAGRWMAQALERLVADNGGTRAHLLASLAGSMMASADMAHATHPNYLERHEPSHHVAMGGGPVIKHNANVRYATESTTAAAFRLACSAADVPHQEYSHRGDMPCGSTIGPVVAAALAVDTVDVGMAQLSMHSAREIMACSDIAMMCAGFTAWLQGGRA